MTQWVEQQICIKFCVKLEHSSMETIERTQKATAVGNWWLAASSWQCTRSCITSRAQFFGETWHPPGDSAPYSPDLVSCDFWLFPKLKSPLKGKRFQTVDEIQENMMEQLMATGRTVWGPKVRALKRTEVSLSCVQCSYIFLNKCLHFPYYMAGYILDRPCINIRKIQFLPLRILESKKQTNKKTPLAFKQINAKVI